MAFDLDDRAITQLQGVHPHLRRVIERAAQISPIPFTVTEGVRTLARQKLLKAQGLSKTLNSRHLTGHAVDIVPIVDVTGDGRVTGDDMWHHSQLIKLAPYIKRAFRECGIPYEWGGDWRNAWDKPHWQLPWRKYPIRTASLGDNDLMEAFVEPPMETPLVTPSAARLIGEGGAGFGGAALIADAASQLQQAEGHLSAGTMLGAVIGSLVLLGAAVALYERWDAAGRPLPGFISRRFSGGRDVRAD